MSTLAEESVVSFSAMARRFLDPPREFVEFAGGLGKEVVVLGPGPVVEVRETRFAQLRIQRFLTGRFGFSATLMLNEFEGAPTRNGMALGLLTRF